MPARLCRPASASFESAARWVYFILSQAQKLDELAGQV